MLIFPTSKSINVDLRPQSNSYANHLTDGPSPTASWQNETSPIKLWQRCHSSAQSVSAAAVTAAAESESIRKILHSCRDYATGGTFRLLASRSAPRYVVKTRNGAPPRYRHPPTHTETPARISPTTPHSHRDLPLRSHLLTAAGDR